MSSRFQSYFVYLACLFAGLFAHAAPLAVEGRAAATVVVSEAEAEVLDEAVGVLERYLREMTGADFVVAGDAGEGGRIFVGLVDARGNGLPSGLVAELKAGSDEAFAIHVDDQDVRLVGKTPLACRHAVYAFLEELGCRWLAPPKAWWVIPASSTLNAAPISVVRDPDYQYRKIRYSYGYTYADKQSDRLLREDLDTYLAANRLGGLTPLNFGHAYKHVIQRNQAVFDAHPEYFAMNKDGQRSAPNLCYSNADLAQIFIAAKLTEYVTMREKNPYARLVSMETNDGSKPCYCPACTKLGGATDQALYLANQVARALRDKHPEALVGMLSYAPHILPPETVKPEPNIIIGIATAFNRSGLTYDDLIDRWSKQVDQMTIREYFGVVEWDFGMPGRGRAANPSYIFRKIPYWHRHGILAIDTQFNAFWGSFGPATYVATKLFWDVDADAEALYDEYCRHAYGSAWETMRDLHLSWADRRRKRVTQQDLHEWLTVVDRARKQAGDDAPQVRRRLVDMMSYLHYVVLFANWEQAQSTNREAAYAALEPMLAYTWRTRERQMTHAYAIQRRLVNAGSPILRPLKEDWHFKRKDAVWRDPRPIDDAEIVGMFEADLAAHPADPRLRAFSHKLVPYLGSDEAEAPGRKRGKTSGITRWHALATTPGQALTIRLESGTLSSCTVTAPDGEIVTEIRRTRADDPNETMVQATLGEPGLYTIELSAMSRYYIPSIEGVEKLVAEASEDASLHSEYWGGLYFYVPKGTREVIVAGGPRLTLQAPSWPKARNFMSKDAVKGAHRIAVGEDDGQIWMIGSLTRASLYFFNIPPYVATSPGALLVPKELQAETAR